MIFYGLFLYFCGSHFLLGVGDLSPYPLFICVLAYTSPVFWSSSLSVILRFGESGVLGSQAQDNKNPLCFDWRGDFLERFTPEPLLFVFRRHPQYIIFFCIANFLFPFKQPLPFPIPIFFQILQRDKPQCCRVHTVPLPSPICWTIVEDMADMCIGECPTYFRTS